MTSKYINKNGGKKLLAVILMMALACAGCVLVLGSEESSATDITAPSPLSSVTEAPSTISAGGSYKVTSDKTVTIINGDVDMTFYVASGVTLILKGVTGHSGTVTILATDADAAYQISNDTKITIGSFVSGEITVKASYSGSAKVASSFEISGSPNGTVTITPGTVGSKVAGTVSVGPSGFEYGDTVLANLTYGTCSKDSTSNWNYTQPNTNQSYTLENSGSATADVVNVLSGTITITDGDNTIKFTKYQAADISSPVVITGPKDGAVYTSVSGGDGDDTGSVTILKGTIKGTFSAVSNTFTGVSNGTVLKAQIEASESYTIYGDYVQKASVSGITKITVSGTLTIPEGKSIVVDEIDDNGKIKVFGSISIDSESSASPAYSGSGVYVGPYGSVGTGITLGENTNVDPTIDDNTSGTLTGTKSDLILSGEATIPAGETLTITGKLGLSGNNLNVDGTLILSSGAVLYSLKNTDTIKLGTKGSIENNGTLGTVQNIVFSDATNTISLSGISGAQFSVVDGVIGISGDLIASGFVKDENGKATGTVTMVGSAVIAGDLTVSDDLTFAAVTTAVISGSKVVIDGAFTGNILIQAGSSLEVSGTMGIGSTIVAESGSIDGAGYVTGTVVLTNVHDTDSPVDEDFITGFTIYSVKSKTDVKVYITGSIEDAVDRPAASDELNPHINIVGNVYIPAEGLTIGSNVYATFSNVVYLDGTLSTESVNVSIGSYVGATYKIKVVTGATTVTTTYYSDVASAMEKIGSAVNKTVTAQIESLDGTIIVSDGQTLDITVTKIKEGASVVAQKGSKLEIDVDTLEGSVVVFNGATMTGTLTAVAEIDSDDKKIYAGFVTAIDMVDAGQTLTVGDVPAIDGDLIVKEGVTIIADSLTVNGNLTVPATSTLKAETISITKVGGGVVTVYGILDLSEGSLANNYKLVSLGTTILSSINTTTMSGAYYTTESGYILTTVAKAVAQATEGEVVVIGSDVKESGDIVLDGITLRVSATKAALGNIAITNSSKVIAQGALTATITDAAPVSLGATVTTLSIDGTTVTVIGSEDGLQINDVNGKVRVISGNVTVTGVISSTNSEFSIDDGAQATIAGNLGIGNGSILNVQGDLIVKGALSVTNNTDVPVIAGTLKALTGSIVSVIGLDVKGFLIAETDSSVSTSGIVIVDDGAVISGKVSPSSVSGSYIKAYAESDVTGMKITGVKKTAFYVNDVLIETIYTTYASIVISDLANGLKIDIAKAIPGIGVPGTLDWKAADDATFVNVGDVDALYLVLGYKKISINVSIQSGTELRIGTDYYTSTGETSKIYYLETPYTIVASDLVGDKSVIFEFYVEDVKQEVTGNQVIFTADMADKKIVILSAYGSAPGPTPAPVDPSEDYVVSTSVVDDKKVIVSVISLDGGYLVAGTEVEVTFTTLVETVAFGQTIYKPTPVTETITIGDDKPTIDNSTYELADILGDKYAVINVISKIGTAGFGNTSLNYKG